MMTTPLLTVKTVSAKADLDLSFVFVDKNKKMIPSKKFYGSTIAKAQKQSSFAGTCGSVFYLPMGSKKPSNHLLLVGLGAQSELTLEKARLAGASVFAKIKAEKIQSLNVQIDAIHEFSKDLNDPAAVVKSFIEGLTLSAYEFDKYRKNKKSHPALKIYLVSKDKNAVKILGGIAKDTMAMIDAVNVTRDWSNEPANIGTPEYYANEAVRLAKSYGIKCTVLSEKEAEKEKMSLYLSVGQGSEREGKIVVLDYHPKDAAKTIALVGKGITFDSGGISIKPSAGMQDMKHDMTGAATMMGAILLAAKRKIQNRVISILAFTENMPSGSAIVPSAVVMTRAGISVENINTDAEGRLILADVLDYAHDFKPDCIVNAATLTGAVVVALGKQCCGIMGNDQGLVNQLIELGQSNHERMWQLPLFDEYLEDMKTDCADLRNVGSDGSGGTIRGGIFLKQFIRKGMKWAHLDIAATAYGMGHVPYYPKKGASGMHVRTLADFVEQFKG